LSHVTTKCLAFAAISAILAISLCCNYVPAVHLINPVSWAGAARALSAQAAGLADALAQPPAISDEDKSQLLES